MRAGYLVAVNTYATREAPRPEPGPGEALVRVQACAFCGSDLHDAVSGWGAPRVPGHEFAGVIEALNDASDQFAVGEAVVVNPIMTCRYCEACRSGHNHLCDHFAVIGCQTPGGFAEYALSPVANLRPRPASLPFEVAALADPLAVALHACELAGDVAGKSALIFGAGAIGLFTLQVLRLKGADDLAISDLVAGHLDVAKKLVPSATTVNAKGDPDYRTLGAKRFDLCFELAGAPSTLPQAIALARRGGLILQVAQRRPTELDCGALVFGEKRLQGVFGQRAENFAQALDLLASGAIDGASLITDVLPLDDMAAAYARVLEPDSIKVVVRP